jgi:hypothetical protein
MTPNEPTTDTIHISITVDVPSGSTGDLTADQVAFAVDTDRIQLSSGHPRHVLSFSLDGTFNDGVEIPPRFCRLVEGDGIHWYSAALESDKNPGLTDRQKQALSSWLLTNNPVVSDDGRSAEVTLNRASIQGILNPGQTLVLMWGIHLQVARNEPSPWLQIQHDPEVDVEMHA